MSGHPVRRHWGLVSAAVGAGGAERVAALLTSGWAERGERVSLVSFAPKTEQPFYDLHPAVDYLPLELTGSSVGVFDAVTANLRRLAVLRRSLRKLAPDVLVSFGTETNILVLIATRGLGLRVIVSERCDPRVWPARRVWRELRRVVYPVADTVVVQTSEAADLLAWHRRVCVIPNPLRSPRPSASHLPETVRRPFLLAVGRLVHQKGFDLLISAFARIGNLGDQWSLVIVGEGPDRAALRRQIDELGLSDRVFLAGQHRDLAPFYSAASAFVLSSRFEGFPNALCEAMSYGLPVVASDCPSGPRRIVRPGVDGWLVPPGSMEGLTAALAEVCADTDRRRAYGAAARKIVDRFGLDMVLATWDEAAGFPSPSPPSP